MNKAKIIPCSQKKGNKNIIRKGENYIHRRTAKQYREFWNYFLEHESKNFFNYMGYTKEDILKIGTKEFIDAMDWTSTKQIDNWKNDKVHIIPCSHCKSHFATFELDFGLCCQCKKLYDTKALIETCNNNANSTNDMAEKSSITLEIISGFIYDDNFRSKFLIRK